MLATLPVVCAFTSLPPSTGGQGINFITEDGLAKDAQGYADHMGVSIDEAMRRFKLQDLAGELDSKLSADDPETFAGMWLEHKPTFQSLRVSLAMGKLPLRLILFPVAL